MHSFIHAFTHSLIHSFTYSFIHLFARSVIICLTWGQVNAVLCSSLYEVLFLAGMSAASLPAWACMRHADMEVEM